MNREIVIFIIIIITIIIVVFLIFCAFDVHYATFPEYCILSNARMKKNPSYEF